MTPYGRIRCYLGLLKRFLHSPGLCTLKEAISEPFEQLPDRTSPRASNSKTSPTAPKTFHGILSWPEFLPGAAHLESGLNDTHRCYQKTALSLIPGKSISTAADECEVRGCVMSVAYGLNHAAGVLGYDVECVGGGSGRSTSYTDLVLRKAKHPSDPDQLSSHILGVCEVKGSWQFSIQRGEKLEDLLQDPQRIDGCIHALQQASCLLRMQHA